MGPHTVTRVFPKGEKMQLLLNENLTNDVIFGDFCKIWMKTKKIAFCIVRMNLHLLLLLYVYELFNYQTLKIELLYVTEKSTGFKKRTSEGTSSSMVPISVKLWEHVQCQ